VHGDGGGHRHAWTDDDGSDDGQRSMKLGDIARRGVVEHTLRAAAVLSFLVMTACAYHMPTQPSDPLPTPSLAPATIRVTASSRTDQKIDVTATVLSSDGHFVQNVTLAFSVDAGTISPTTAVTDANGTARVLASTPSATTLHVSGAGLSA